MDQKTLNFTGYFTSKSYVPSQSGIYCVYRGTHNDNNTVSLNQLLYIGESGNAHDRLDTHEREKDWKRHLKYGEILIFTFAPIVAERVRAEAAMIYKHKPTENTEYKHSFPFRSLKMTLTGCTNKLYTQFTVYDTRTILTR